MSNISDGSYASSLPNIGTAAADAISQGLSNLLIKRQKNKLATDQTASGLITQSDNKWVKQAFLVNFDSLDPVDQVNRTFTRAAFKFNDSSLGGSYAINPRPQFTPYADIRPKSFFRPIQSPGLGSPGNSTNADQYESYSANLGIGRYYSEAIDDPSQIIHMRFGVPKFNSLTTFFTGFFNSYSASIARTGRGTLSLNNISYIVGRTLGLVVSVLWIPLLLINAIGNSLRFFLKKPSSKFYYLKPTMITYWSAVNVLVNQIGVNRGLYAKVPFTDDNSSNSLNSNVNQNIGTGFKIDPTTMGVLSALMPDVFSPDGGIDVYSAASRAQRKKNQFDRNYNALLNNAAAEGTADPLSGLGYIVNDPSAIVNDRIKFRSFGQAIADWFDTGYGSVQSDAVDSQGNKIPSTDAEINQTSTDASGNLVNADSGFADSLINYFAAEWDDGTAFASFKVDYTGSVGESFSNSAVESDLQQKINSTSSSARNARFTFADGNLVGGAVGSAAGAITDVVGGLVSGAVDSLGISGLMALGGSAFADIPKHWDSSTASLPKSTYTMTLISPYGNPISQMINIYIPLAMILAAALPLATGKQSYTSPFLIEMYDRGRSQTRLGMIDSLSITRGTSNLGFNKEAAPMAMEVSFSVMDLSSILTMPVSQGFSFNPLEGIFDDENVYTDYVATLSSLSMPQQFYQYNKLKLNIAKKLRSYKTLSSPARWMAMAHEYTPVGWLDVAFKGIQAP